MSVLRRLAIGGAAAASAGGVRALPRPAFAPVSGAALLGDAASDGSDAAPDLDVPGRGERVAPTRADRRDSGDPGARAVSVGVPAAGYVRAPETPAAMLTPRGGHAGRSTAATVAPAAAAATSETGPVSSTSGDIAPRITLPQADLSDSRTGASTPMAADVGPDDSRSAEPGPSRQRRTPDAAETIEIVETLETIETIETIETPEPTVETRLRPRSPGEASWSDRAVALVSDGGEADGAPRHDPAGSANDAAPPIEVRIGTIEVFESSPPPPSRSRSGFAEYAAIRSYDWGDHG